MSSEASITRYIVAKQTCAEIKIYGAFVLNRRVVLHAIDATPARRPTHWLISTQ